MGLARVQVLCGSLGLVQGNFQVRTGSKRPPQTTDEGKGRERKGKGKREGKGNKAVS